MSKIQVTLNIDDEMLLKESNTSFLEDAINHELGWLRDSGMYAESWSFIEPHEKQMQTFYYTFGTSKGYPFQKGWVEVQAEDRKQADDLFRKKYPDNFPGYLNCAFVYTEYEFAEIREQYKKENPDWCVCHDTINQTPADPDKGDHKNTLSSIIHSAEKRKPQPNPDSAKTKEHENMTEREGERS